jgi:hypothetical protein
MSAGGNGAQPTRRRRQQLTDDLLVTVLTSPFPQIHPFFLPPSPPFPFPPPLSTTGKKILNEYIALGIYGLTGLGAWAATRGGSEAKAPAAIDPKVQSTSCVPSLPLPSSNKY